MQVLINHWMGFVGLFAALLVMLEIGRQIGRWRIRANPATDTQGVSPLENTLLALLGLLLAFSFSGSWSRFDARRDLILRESNAIGTAWLRLDLLPAPAREHLRDAFRRYVDLRLEETEASEPKPGERLTALQQAIWSEAVASSLAAGDGRVGQLLLPALNDMFDVASARYVAVQTHPPAVIFLMLLAITFLACLLAGYGMAGRNHRNWLHILCFSAAMVLAIYVTIDLEYPRRGLIRVDGYDQLLVDLRAGMK
jgi:hypothetical protein